MTEKSTDKRSQIERFREAARAAGADEDPRAFREKLAVIARQKPKDEPTPKRPKKP